jgi:hypothetical protein
MSSTFPHIGEKEFTQTSECVNPQVKENKNPHLRENRIPHPLIC